MYQILIVDDEEIVCRGLAQFVKWKEHGFEVAGIAYSVNEAISLLEKIHIDVIFTDIRMPGKTGLDLLHVTKDKYPEIKSIILSGFSDFAYTKEAIRCGAIDYLTKPVNLDEVGVLLNQLKEKFIQTQEVTKVHSNRVEALLSSIARGYSKVEPEKYQLPVLENWYGLSLSLIHKGQPEEIVLEKLKMMNKQISAIIPSTIILKRDVYTFFAIIPCKSQSEFDSFITILEQICNSTKEWTCGVSKFKNGISDLPHGWREANQALCYHCASIREGVIFYENIEPFFSKDYPEIQNLTDDLIRRLNNPETRSEILPWFPESLIAMQPSNLTITEFQTLCIRCLIELNAFLQGLSIESNDLQKKLNQTLNQILISNSTQSTINCITTYLQWVIDLVNESSKQKMDNCVIDEIQTFIRQHYNENITLNMLAEQFYLHPNYLSRLFKEKSGDNFVDYLTKVRMDKIKELLLNTDHKIIEICYMVGYNNSRYFNKVFKQNTGMTPSEYRQSYTI